MGHQHQRAGEFGEAVFQHFERGDVEIVGGLVEQQQVGRLQHQAGDQDARLLAAGEAGDGPVELAGVEEEALGPAGDVDGAVVEDHVCRRARRGPGAASASRSSCSRAWSK